MHGEVLLGVMGILMIATIVWALIQSKTNPVPIFVIVPIIAAVIVGFGPQDIFEFIKVGVSKTWSTAVLFIFSIVFFSLMGDVGLFDPMVNWLAKKAGNNIMAVTIATSLIAVIAHMDGALASTLLITIPAMLPVYKKLHIRPVTLLVIIGAAMSIMNLVPWGGPVARTGVVLNADVNALWQELIPLQGIGLVILVVFAGYMGMVEKRRGAGLNPTGEAALLDSTIDEGDNIGPSQADFDEMKRPKLIWVNLIITLGVIGLLCFTKIPLYGAFMLGLALALIINFPGAKAQSKAIKMHADTALTMPMILLASGVFLGVLSGTKMMESMATLLIGLVPEAIGGHLQTVFGILGVPIGMLLGTDSYFFGLLPLAISVGENFGVDGHSMAMAMLISKNYGVLVTPHAATTFLACGLAGVEIKDMLKFCAPRLFILSLISLACGAMLGLFTI
ncbi:MAG: TRAP transporter large permease subunit [Veillonella sp.]|jgi:CitMHS family citrate-Mg2+:H+ or citrate-Ca2+:H+ symporter|uniref:CitMHS family transporter n=1 Tax=Veillonella sp. TaxID=1926307 RepID=UPI001B5DB00D|nr:citrate:proton symporter [Veillonella sp.]MBK7920835.1 TRAP transporter large permease subunit [Veillonella sp.]MBP6923639.1 TRAP transporter large permease subunit [Veillonella sp.]MBP8616894.1 TRAP transporter large permease subunit [Veillonella sp.]MBP9516516.1 TRAP transporter large permease subunit [Veillonella sp.]MBP9550406.1 TRAP transporter large permease subunit [Veillonella sp.]